MVPFKIVVTAYQQTCEKMFSQASASHSASGGGVSLVSSPFGGVGISGTRSFQGVGMCVCVAGMYGVVSMSRWVGMSGVCTSPPPRYGIQWDTVGKWVVRILLECFLVLYGFTATLVLDQHHTYIHDSVTDENN